MRILVLLLLITSPFLSYSQDISGGVRIGLNLNRFTGPMETDSNGNELETFDNNTGFLVGGLLDVSLNDFFGFRGELLFSQKGGRILYDGDSKMIFNPGTGDEVVLVGSRKSVVRTNNSYLDFPIMAYVRPIPKVKIFAGVNLGYLVSSTGFGELDFQGKSEIGQVPFDFTITLDHNYIKDDGYNSDELIEPVSFNADGSTIQIPSEAGAYILDFAEKGDPTYNRFDFGGIAGLAYYMNSNLFISGMVNFGLIDISNNDKDFSKIEVNDQSQVFREDIDKNLSIQFSIGFQF